ncbi:hypothetical protein FQN60_014651, partial [Etheostoma spectabile]
MRPFRKLVPEYRRVVEESWSSVKGQTGSFHLSTCLSDSVFIPVSVRLSITERRGPAMTASASCSSGLEVLLSTLQNGGDVESTLNILNVLDELLSAGKLTYCTDRRIHYMISKGGSEALLIALVKAGRSFSPNYTILLPLLHLLAKVGHRDRRIGVKAEEAGAVLLTLNLLRQNAQHGSRAAACLWAIQVFCSSVSTANLIGANHGLDVIYCLIPQCSPKHLPTINIPSGACHEHQEYLFVPLWLARGHAYLPLEVEDKVMGQKTSLRMLSQLKGVYEVVLEEDSRQVMCCFKRTCSVLCPHAAAHPLNQQQHVMAAIDAFAALLCTKANVSSVVSKGYVSGLLRLYEDWHSKGSEHVAIRHALLRCLHKVTHSTAGRQAVLCQGGIRLLYETSQTCLLSRGLESLVELSVQLMRKCLPKTPLPLTSDQSAYTFPLPGGPHAVPEMDAEPDESSDESDDDEDKPEADY